MSQFSSSKISRRENWRVIAFAAMSVLLFSGAGQMARAADGDLDPTFGNGGKVVTDFSSSNDWLSRITVQPDGKIVAIGVTHPSHRGALARYHPDGTLDATFGDGGKVVTVASVRESAAGLLILSDGKILISGSIDLPSSQDTSFVLLRYNSDGSVDPTFGNGGTVMTNIAERDDQAYALALQSDGKIVAAGRRGIQFYPSEQRKGNVALARYNPDGSLDPTFGNGGKVITDFGQGLESYAIALMIQPDGRIVIAGEGSYYFLVARYNSDGTLDPSFAGNGYAFANFSSNWDGATDALLQPDGKIVLVGWSIANSPYDSFAMARFNSDGSFDQSFGNGGKVLMLDQGDLNAVVLQGDGKLVALGTSNSFSDSAFQLLRFDVNGALDSTFGTDGTVMTSFGGTAEGSDLVLQADGKLLAGGLTSSDPYFQNSDFALARYLDNANPPPTPAPTATPEATPTPTPIPTATPEATPTPIPTATPAATPPSTPTPAPTATPDATATPPAKAVNLSTRMRIQTGDNVGIGGFIITGTAPKHVLIRAIGPSLAALGVPDVLADPVLELNGPGTFVTVTNNNWREDAGQEALIAATGIPPADDLESAIDAMLAPGAYTAIVRGNGDTDGAALVEVYDLEAEAASKLANISTRALVGTADNIVIAGFMLSGQGGSDRVVVRGIGPSLADAGVPDALADPTLELRDSNGALLIANNDWQDDLVQSSQLTSAGLAPPSNLESALVMNLPPGLYTALLAGRNSGSGIGLLEVYDRVGQ